jgi:hypothetical protein
MKRYITVWGSSTNDVFIRCYECGERFSWLKAEEVEPGLYATVCRKCKLKVKGK